MAASSLLADVGVQVHIDECLAARVNSQLGFVIGQTGSDRDCVAGLLPLPRSLPQTAESLIAYAPVVKPCCVAGLNLIG